MKRLKLLLLLTGILLSGCSILEQPATELQSDQVSFKKCTDGDTAHFIIDGKDTTVRFLAVDTPETVKPGTPVQPYGKEASAYTCNAITNAKEIKLEYEESNLTDKYGRTLAWVFVDGHLLQLELVEKGYADVKYLYGNYKYTQKLLDAQTKAKDLKEGRWIK